MTHINQVFTYRNGRLEPFSMYDEVIDLKDQVRQDLKNYEDSIAARAHAITF